jgi:lipid II:glycine glycyltransferase (peptidoglycan interpeptide bridge formation enzyme)
MGAMRAPSLKPHAVESIPVAAKAAGDDWDVFVVNHPAGHVLQLSGWGALKVGSGWQAEQVSVPDGAQGGAIQAGALLLFQRRLGLTLGYVPRGPLVVWNDTAMLRALLEALRASCREHGASVLKVEPELADTPANRATLASLGLRPSMQSVQPRSTIQLDITGSEDEILARMKSKWRYNVRLAERKGITVRACSEADLPVFNALMAETAQRDRFDVHSAAYYNAAFALLAPEHANFLLAEFEGRPVAAIVVCAVGHKAWYLWGASSDSERNRMPNHALQWAGMRWARSRGATLYDFWGIPDELGQLAQGLRNGDGSGTPVEELPVELERLPSHDLWGVYRFKQGFGGHVVRTVGAWDMPVNALGHSFYQIGLKAQGAQRVVQGARLARRAPVESVYDASQWRQALAGLPHAHLLQSWEWGEIKAQTGWRAERLLLPEGAGAAQFLTRQPLPGLPLRIGYVPKGPLVDWSDARAIDAALDALQAHGRARNCVLVKIDPNVLEATAEGASLLRKLRARGWLYSGEQIQFKNTACTDLRLSEDALLEQMKSKARYNVRLAERRGVTIREGTAADFDAFYALYAETGARDGFLIRPAAYYLTTWQTFLAAQADAVNPAGGALLLAEHPDETRPVAGILLLKYGQCAWYFYGASSERRRRDMPNYLLQWEALRWAKAHGCTTYDWWGAPTNPDDATDAMQGVWGFKQGMGAVLQEHVGAWDYPVSRPLYWAYQQMLPRALAFMRHRGRTV